MLIGRKSFRSCGLLLLENDIPKLISRLMGNWEARTVAFITSVKKLFVWGRVNRTMSAVILSHPSARDLIPSIIFDIMFSSTMVKSKVESHRACVCHKRQVGTSLLMELSPGTFRKWSLIASRSSKWRTNSEFPLKSQRISCLSYGQNFLNFLSCC